MTILGAFVSYNGVLGAVTLMTWTGSFLEECSARGRPQKERKRTNGIRDRRNCEGYLPDEAALRYADGRDKPIRRANRSEK